MINIREIDSFIAVCEEQNITAAARKLFISQPALSKTIAQIEKKAGARLFIRNSSGAFLTHEGRIYLEGCRKVRNIYSSVSQQIEDMQNERRGKITLGISSRTGAFILPRALELFSSRFPDIELSLVEDDVPAMEALVLNGVVDLALTYSNRNPELEFIFMKSDPIWLMVPPRLFQGEPGWSPGFDNPALPPRYLDGKPLIIFKKGRGMRQVVDDFCSRQMICPVTALETNSLQLAYEMVLQGRGFALLPGVFVEKAHRTRPGMFCSVQGESMHRTFYACFRKDSYRKASVEFLVQALRDTM